MLMFLIPFSVCVVCSDACVRMLPHHGAPLLKIADTYGQIAGGSRDASISTEEEKGGADPASSKHFKQMAISKQASSIFVDTTSFLKLLLFGIFAIIIHTVNSFQYQINY